MNNTTSAESINGVKVKPVLNGNICSHFNMKYAATGKATMQDNPTRATKFLVINGMIWPILAPITFRMLISFCLCDVVNAINPKSPRHVMSIVSTENAVNIFPRF